MNDSAQAGALRAREPSAAPVSRDLAALLAALHANAAQRDHAGGHAAQEKQWIAEAGLLTLAIPREFGGEGAPWPEIYEVIRKIAQVDSALAHLLGFTFLQEVSVYVWGNPAQRERYLRGTVKERWWWGNAVNPLDTRLAATATGDGGYVLNGQKGFCSGTRGSQMMTVSAQDPQSGTTLFAVVPTARAGITANDDWNPIGQRQTDSGSVSFAQVRVEPDEVLDRADTPYASLRTLVSQQVMTNLFVGIAQGALEEARAYVTQHGKPWLTSGVAKATDDPYLIQRFGEMRIQAVSAEALAVRAAQALDAAWREGPSLSAQARAHVALATSEAKIVAHRAALDVSEKLFDACGARATHGPLALDRFWRNARVHTLHDPLDYRVRDVGRFALNGTLPEVSLYT
ncbi:acyl-CoA dehydrogenase family protein [Burkholderia sp. WSM2232]|uniref:acyl-CoA dehydrogenase family protein n=1 Tax=Burkholderia sp. WSM2232 TaxID=944436 RepID=UPI0004271B08|nr:acyl-CoA dehydrogenase family protein [Burkholderia sp. WSM2232]